MGSAPRRGTNGIGNKARQVPPEEKGSKERRYWRGRRGCGLGVVTRAAETAKSVFVQGHWMNS